MEKRIRFLNDPVSAVAVSGERAFLKRLEGGCQVPIAAYGQTLDSTLRIDGLVGTIDGKRLIRHRVEGPVEKAESLGIELAEILLNQGSQRDPRRDLPRIRSIVSIENNQNPNENDSLHPLMGRMKVKGSRGEELHLEQNAS